MRTAVEPVCPPLMDRINSTDSDGNCRYSNNILEKWNEAFSTCQSGLPQDKLDGVPNSGRCSPSHSRHWQPGSPYYSLLLLLPLVLWYCVPCCVELVWPMEGSVSAQTARHDVGVELPMSSYVRRPVWDHASCLCSLLFCVVYFEPDGVNPRARRCRSAVAGSTSTSTATATTCSLTRTTSAAHGARLLLRPRLRLRVRLTTTQLTCSRATACRLFHNCRES